MKSQIKNKHIFLNPGMLSHLHMLLSSTYISSTYLHRFLLARFVLAVGLVRVNLVIHIYIYVVLLVPHLVERKQRLGGCGTFKTSAEVAVSCTCRQIVPHSAPSSGLQHSASVGVLVVPGLIGFARCQLMYWNRCGRQQPRTSGRERERVMRGPHVWPRAHHFNGLCSNLFSLL